MVCVCLCVCVCVQLQISNTMKAVRIVGMIVVVVKLKYGMQSFHIGRGDAV